MKNLNIKKNDNGNLWETNERGSALCYTCGRYSIHIPNQKHRLFFWTDKEETDILICRNCLAYSKFKGIFTINPHKEETEFRYHVTNKEYKKWTHEWFGKLQTFSSSIEGLEEEGRRRGSRSFSIITGSGRKIYYHGKKIEAWTKIINSFKKRGIESFLFAYEVDKITGEFSLGEDGKIFPLWERNNVDRKEKTLNIEKSEELEKLIEKVVMKKLKEARITLETDY